MERDLDRVYRVVNEAWGRKRSELPPITGPEAITAVKKLWKKWTGVTVRDPFKIVSGNRHNRRWIDYWAVNPDHGWWALVHHVSHHVHFRLFPGKPQHDGTQANIERNMIEYVVASGWLDGKLKRPVRQKPKVDVKAVRHARVLARIKKWEAKRKRAETALKTLRRQKAYYEKNGAPSMDSNLHPSQYKSAALPIGAIGA